MLKLRKIAVAILKPFYILFNFFYFPFLKRYYFKKIEKVPRNTQLFFMTRFDFGTWLLLMHYAQCWHHERGPACLVMFTPPSHQLVQLCSLACPDVKVIHFHNLFSRFLFCIFRRAIIQFYTLNRIYAFAVQRWPYALFLYDMVFELKMRDPVSSYVPAFDPILKEKWPFTAEFRQAYLSVHELMDYRRPILQDAFKLHYQVIRKSYKAQIHDARDLLKELGIQTPYVIMNLNTKDYRNAMKNSRRINYPKRYNLAIDFLISKGYSVVMQGREEQPLLPPRKGYIEYFNSRYVSTENDFKLYARSVFSISCKTGPEIFASICNIPSLGLNYTELAAIIPNGRCRFFPKHVWDSKKQEFIHWKDLLQRPCFYHTASTCHEDGIEFVDLEEEEILEAVKEFLELLPQTASTWTDYSTLQREFRQALHPAHLDLFDTIEVPCDSYLSSPKYERISKKT